MIQRISPAQYDAWYSTPRGRWIGATEFSILHRHIGSTPGASVMDIGCGTGWFSRRFAAAGFHVTGVDIDSESIAFARSASRPEISFAVADARRLPFPDRSFDHVISVTALCFVDDWARALHEVVRVARRGWVVGLLNRHSLLWWQKGRCADSTYAGAHWHTLSELREALKSMDAESVRLRTAVFWPSGARVARAAECVMPNWLPWGSFLLASGCVT